MRRRRALPPSVRLAAKRRIEAACSRLDPDRYHQEPAYVAALCARLDQVLYEGVYGRLELKCTVVGDRGRDSGEKRFGADLGIVTDLQIDARKILKASVGQAKRAHVLGAPSFEDQVNKMRRLTDAVFGLEVPESASEPVIRIIRFGEYYRATNNGMPWAAAPGIPLSEYLLDVVCACDHGDPRPECVAQVSNSDLRPPSELRLEGAIHRLL